MATSLAFAAHVAFLIIVPPIPLVADAAFYDQDGQNIAAGLGHTINGDPVSTFMPGYPLFIAGTYALFGHHVWIVRLAQCALVAAAAAGLFLIAARVGYRFAVICFLVVALLPAWFIYPGTLNAESLLLALEVLFLGLTLRDSGPTLTWATASGASCGLLAVIKPEFFLWLPLPWLVRRQRPIGVTIAASIFGFALVLAPWTIRNAHHFHRLIPFSTLTGHALWLSAHEPALTDFSGPEFKAALTACDVPGDPVATDACLLSQGKQMVVQHPGYFLKSSLLRLAHTLLGSHTDYLPSNLSFSEAWQGRHLGLLAIKAFMLLVQTLFVFGALVGLAWLCRERRFWFLAYLLASQVAVYALLFGNSRYGLHLTPIFAAGWGALGRPQSDVTPRVSDFGSAPAVS